VGLNSLKSLNLTNVYPNNNNKKNNNKVKSKPLELRSRVKINQFDGLKKVQICRFSSDEKLIVSGTEKSLRTFPRFNLLKLPSISSFLPVSTRKCTAGFTFYFVVVHTYSLVLHMKQSSFSRVRTK
jgi:hypothetical protein